MARRGKFSGLMPKTPRKKSIWELCSSAGVLAFKSIYDKQMFGETAFLE